MSQHAPPAPAAGAHGTRPRVRCYGCGRVQGGGAEACSRCGAQLVALCMCGARHSVYDAACPGCGAECTPKRFPFRRHPLVRTVRVAVPVLLLGLVLFVALRPEPVPGWKLKAEALELLEAGDARGALEKCSAAVLDNPNDKLAWYAMAVCYRQLGLGPEVYVPCLDKVLLLDPAMGQAALFRAQVEAERGRIAEAARFAAVAARDPQTRADGHALLGELEFRKPRPDRARAVLEFQRARAAGLDDPRIVARIAESRLALYAGARNLPPEVEDSLSEGLAALVALAPPAEERAALELLRGRIQLALGQHEAAYAAASAVLNALPEEETRARAMATVLRGQARHLRGDEAEALADFGTALALSPEAESAVAIADFLAREDETSKARGLLTQAIAGGDPSGALHGVRASLLSLEGRHQEAVQDAEVARSRAPEDPYLALLEGDVHAARGDRPRARESYAAAADLLPGDPLPALRAAELAVDDAQARPAAIATAAQWAERVPEEPEAWRVLGRLRLADGDFDGARTALERATELAPAMQTAWLALGRALEAGPGPLDEGRQRAAAAAYAQARKLAPDDPAAAVLEARARLRAGEAATAIAVCESVLAHSPDVPELLRLQAEGFRSLEMWEKAAQRLQSLRAALEAEGRPDPAVVLLLVDCTFRTGDRKAASRLLAEEIERAGPELRSALRFLEVVNSRSIERALEELAAAGPTVLLARLELEAGRIEAAAATSREILRAAPGDPAATQILVLALLSVAEPGPERIAEARAAAEALAPTAPPGLAEFLAGRTSLAEDDLGAALPALRAAALALPMDAYVQLCYGDAAWRAGEQDEGLAALRRAVRLPDARPAAAWLAAERLLGSARRAGTRAASLSLAREAIALRPDHAASSEFVATLLHRSGEFGAAAVVAERGMLACGAGTPQGLVLRRRAVLSRFFAGHHAQALALLASGPESERASEIGLAVRGWSELRAGRPAEALTWFEALERSAPGNPLVRLGRFEVSLARGRLDEALGQMESWPAEGPDGSTLRLAACRALRDAGHVERALAAVRAVRAAEPRSFPAIGLEVELLGRAGRDEEAVAQARAFAQGLAGGDRLEAELFAAGLEVRALRRTDAALDVARAVRSDPAAPEATRVEAAILEAEVRLLEQRHADAKDLAEEALARLPADEQARERADTRELVRRARFVLGVVAANAGSLGLAAEHFSRCLALEADDHASANNLAWIWSRDPATATRALELARQATRLVPGEAEYWDTQAEAALAVADAAEAEAACRRGAELAEADGDADVGARCLLRLAGLLHDGGRHEEARGVAARALEVAAPGSAAAAEARQLLGR